MPLTKMRRPKFERQNVKQSLFSVSLSNQRLDKIQFLIKENKLDCLLIIIGIDSRFNMMCQEVFNYLFFDVFTTRQDDITRSKLDDFVFDDVMICIKVDSVHVYCNGANYWLLLPYMAHWPGLELHCLSEIEMEDAEEFENFKINCFIELTRGCNTVGVCTMSSEEDSKKFDHMVLENWPIVQTFGHDNFGKVEEKKRGFFTMVHKIVDISSQLNTIIYDSLDPISVETVYTKVLPQMEGVFENIFQLIDSNVRADYEKICLDEEIFEEPVLSYFKHLVNTAQVDQKFDFKPFVLSGSNTQRTILKGSVLSSDELKQDRQIQNERKKKIENPLHIVLQCVNNQFDIVIGRSIFLHSASDLAFNNDDGKNDELIHNINILSTVYNAMIKTIENAVASVKQGLSPGLLNLEEIENDLKKKIFNFKFGSIKIRITPCKQGSSKSYQTTHMSTVIIQAIVWDIEAHDHSNLGSLVYSDTFIVTNLPTNKETSINALTRVGKNIQNYNYWSQYNDLHGVMKNTKKLISDEEMISMDTVNVLIPSCHFNETRMFNVCAFIYPSQLLLYAKRTGLAILKPISVEIYEKDSYSDWCVIELTLNSTDVSKLNDPWLWFDSDKSTQSTLTVYLTCSIKGPLRKCLAKMPITQSNQPIESNSTIQSIWILLQYTLRNVTTATTGHGDSSVSIIESLNDEHSHISSSVPLSPSVPSLSLVKLHQNVINNSITYNKSVIKVLCNLTLLGYKLRNGFDWSNFDWSDIKRDIIRQCKTHGNSLIKLDSICDDKDDSQCIESDDNDDEKNRKKVVLTVLCGPPFSGQKLLVNKIMNVVKDNVDWQLVRPNQMADILPLLKTAYIKTAMSSPQNQYIEHNSQQRIILIAPAMMTPQIVYSHIKQFTVKHTIEIGSFCTLIDSKTAFRANSKVTLPGLLDLCNEGFCQSVLLVGSEKNSEDLRRLLKIRNDLCTIHLVISPQFSGEISKQLDSILSTTAFNQPRQSHARLLSLTANQMFNPIMSLANTENQSFCRIASGFYRLIMKISNNHSGDKGVVFSKQQIVQNLTVQSNGKCKLDSNKYFPQIQFLEGYLMVNDDKFYEFHWSRCARYVSMQQIKSNQLSSSQKPDPTQLVFYVVKQDCLDTADPMELYAEMKQSLSVVVQEFLPKPVPKKSMLKKTDLSSEIIESIHAKRHLECLPEGWFYNGLTYVNMDGSRSEKHPNFLQFIADYLEEENERIKQYNCHLDDHKITTNKVEIE